VPYRSQIGAGASAYANDCGAACANMAFQYALEQAGLGQARGVTVDDMARDSALVGNGDRGLTPSQVVTLLAAYGVRAEARRAVTPEALVQEIDARRPIICLVAYKHIRPQDAFDGGHYVVVKGYGRYGFYVHDPYNGGADYYVSRAALVEAMRDVSPFASIPNQAVVLTPAPK
jgi:ABC-type bacteriocin/lantibiotic exporter with double-glycine peptidase domain